MYPSIHPFTTSHSSYSPPRTESTTPASSINVLVDLQAIIVLVTALGRSLAIANAIDRARLADAGEASHTAVVLDLAGSLASTGDLRLVVRGAGGGRFAGEELEGALLPVAVEVVASEQGRVDAADTAGAGVAGVGPAAGWEDADVCWGRGSDSRGGCTGRGDGCCWRDGLGADARNGGGSVGWGQLGHALALGILHT